jgi:hypothetical protein
MTALSLKSFKGWWGKGEVMTQTLYALMKKKKKVSWGKEREGTALVTKNLQYVI